MTYQYSFDTTTAGDKDWRRADFLTIHKSFKLLLHEIQAWNKRALDHGASRKPYEREEAEIKDYIAWGEKQLSDVNKDVVVVHGTSVGTFRYIKTALLLAARLREREVAKKSEEGRPNGALSALTETVDILKRLASRINYLPSDILWELIPKSENEKSTDRAEEAFSETEWDVFICHASEDKEGFVRNLANELLRAGLKVWYDELTLKVGDSLRRSIDRGLAHSRYGIVVVSPAFLRKEWAQKELDALASLEVNGRKIILPVWHEIEADEVRRYSPILADRLATSSKKDLAHVVADLVDAMGGES